MMASGVLASRLAMTRSSRRLNSISLGARSSRAAYARVNPASVYLFIRRPIPSVTYYGRNRTHDLGLVDV